MSKIVADIGTFFLGSAVRMLDAGRDHAPVAVPA
jgi:hypothetical protein